MSTAERFRHSMQLLSPRLGEEGRWVVVPGSVRTKPSSQRRALRQQRVLKRRRFVLVVLVWMAAGSLAAALLGAPGGWISHIAIDAALVGHAAFLIETKRRRIERRRKVRPIDQRRARREAEFDFFEPAISK